MKIYEPEKYADKLFIDFVRNFYCPRGDLYLYQSIANNRVVYFPKKKINTSKNSLNNNFVLYNHVLQNHFHKQKTIAIFPYEKKSKFLDFDIDMMDVEILESIYHTLIKLGLTDDQVLMSESGFKGYHVTIFFEEFVSHEKLYDLFTNVISEANIDRAKAKKIEALGCINRATKLPLSINNKAIFERKHYNKENDLDGECYFINYMTGKIDPIEKIESMKKIPVEFVNRINKEHHSDRNTTSLSVYNAALPKNYDAIDDETDIIVPGTRHNRLLQKAYSNKALGDNQEKNYNNLVNWSTDKKHCYSTSCEENIEDIKRIVNYVYKHDSCHTSQVQYPIDISFSQEEIDDIFSLKNRVTIKFYFFILLHYKLYSNAAGEFGAPYNSRFLSYMNNQKKNELLNYLASINKIEFVRKHEIVTTKNRKTMCKPNLFKLNNENTASCPQIYHLILKNETDSPKIIYNDFLHVRTINELCA